jgi:hypothetical protein
MSTKPPQARGRIAAGLLAIGALVGLHLAAADATAPDDHRSVGRVDSCTTDAQGGCNINLGFGEKPTAIDVQESGATGFEAAVVNPVNTSISQYRVTFWQTTTARMPAGTPMSFYVAFHFGPPDSTAPDTTITSAPAASTNSTSAAFAFESTEPGTFECKLDTGAYTACTPPVSYTGLADGGHTFSVQAVDDAGNVDGTPAAHAWSIDATPPQTTITSAPPVSTTDTTAAFEFSANETGSTFECKLDAGAFASCTSPKSYADLAVGAHTFEVRATDALGNTDPTPSTHAWEITAPPPPPPPAPSTKPGMGGTVWGDSDWPGWEAEMGSSANRRTYDGSLPANFEASKAGSANDYEANRESWWSYKPAITSTGISSTSQTALANFLRTVPVGHPFVLTIYHEPEDNIAAGSISFQGWLAAQRQGGAIVDQINAEKGANSKLQYASILMSYWTFDTRGYAGQGWRNLTAADWANVDIIGFDPYKRNANDPSMEQMMTRENSGTLTGTAESAMSNAVSWGKKIAIPEWGVTRTPNSGSVTDAQRATWITDAYNWFKAWNTANPNNPVTDATYFHIDNFFENGQDPVASWEVINIGGGLAETALRNAMADSRN